MLRIVRPVALTVGLLCSAGSSRALAWGCEGHEAVAILAERLLDAASANAARAVLAASADPALERFCEPVPGSAMAHASTWADDHRAREPSTAGWHFINVPRAGGDAREGSRQYCPRGNCILDAIVSQFRTLTTTSNAREKGSALRFLIHFVGDLHQPLHAITNGDRGGNCLPITYRNRRPREDDRQGFAPNLHELWDALLIRELMDRERLADARALAEYFARGHALRGVVRAPTPDRVAAWALESTTAARRVVYGPLNVPMEPATAVLLRSCADNNNVSRRLAKLDVRISRAYEDAAVPLIAERIRLAAERLAGILLAAFQ